MSRTAVILLNFGGPDSPGAVQPFLFNMFNDPAVFRLPQPLRAIAAAVIALVRSSKAREIYDHIGGKSPILEQTKAQAEALEAKLGREYKVFVCMRHWHPMSDAVAKEVSAYAPEHILLLPLYPQYSTVTTDSAFDAWDRAARKAGIAASTGRLCCYPADLGFVAAQAAQIRDAYWQASEHGKPRLLFSAHGLPESIIAEGDPYAWQVEKTVAAIVQVLSIDEIDYAICYQSQVGSKRWIGPSIGEEIAQAARDKVPVVVIPVSFVSEHSETLYELDMLYRNRAAELSVPGYWRVPALGASELFIEALADLCRKIGREPRTCSFQGERFCPRNFTQCPCE